MTKLTFHVAGTLRTTHSHEQSDAIGLTTAMRSKLTSALPLLEDFLKDKPPNRLLLPFFRALTAPSSSFASKGDTEVSTSSDGTKPLASRFIDGVRMESTADGSCRERYRARDFSCNGNMVKCRPTGYRLINCRKMRGSPNPYIPVFEKRIRVKVSRVRCTTICCAAAHRG